MTLEDVFLLSRLLEIPSIALLDVFGKFDKIRRPCVKKFYKKAVGNGGRRMKIEFLGTVVQRAGNLGDLVGVQPSQPAKGEPWRGGSGIQY
jgi:hypothetical protein